MNGMREEQEMRLGPAGALIRAELEEQALDPLVWVLKDR